MPDTRSTDTEEALAFGLLAKTLMVSLDLRPDCFEQVLADLHQERDLVVGWLERQGRAG